jgi:DNA-binding transcriptional ArsR family regulator
LDDPEFQELARAPHVSLEEILRNPRFPAARKLYLDRFLEVYGHDPFLVRLLIESGRFLVYQLAVVLDAGQDPVRRGTWFTVGRLKQQIASSGLGASERQVDHLIARLREVGFLDVLPSDKDRRLQILRPTEKMLTHDRDWLAAHYAPLTLLCPQTDYGPIMRRDPELQVLHRRTAMAFVPLGMKLLLSVPDMMLFFYRAGGQMVLAALLQAAMADPDHPHTAVPYADMGDRFGVSRTHVRQLLVAAQEAGLVNLKARGGRRVEILPRLWAS